MSQAAIFSAPSGGNPIASDTAHCGQKQIRFADDFCRGRTPTVCANMYTATDLSPDSISRRQRKQQIACTCPPMIVFVYCRQDASLATSKKSDSAMAGGLPTQCSLRGVGGWPTQRGFRCVGILSARKNTRVPRFWPLLPDVGIFVCTDKNFVRARIHPPIMPREPPPLPRRIHHRHKPESIPPISAR